MVAQHKALQVASKGSVLATRQSSLAMNDLSGALGVVSPRLGALAGAAGPLTTLAIALGAVGGAGASIFMLAKSTAEYGGHLKDLNDQTGIGVANLSALKIAFDQSGGSIDSGATALSRYLRSVSDFICRKRPAVMPVVDPLKRVKKLGVVGNAFVRLAACGNQHHDRDHSEEIGAGSETNIVKLERFTNSLRVFGIVGDVRVRVRREWETLISFLPFLLVTAILEKPLDFEFTL